MPKTKENKDLRKAIANANRILRNRAASSKVKILRNFTMLAIKDFMAD